MNPQMNMNNDRQHLKLLSIFHYIVGGILAFFFLFHKGCLFPLSFRKSLTCFSFSIKLNIYLKSCWSLLILPDSDRFYF